MTCDRCEELERLLGLREEFPPSLKLSATMKRVLGVLRKREFIGSEALFTAVWGAIPERDQPHFKILAVYICKLRTALKPYGITIETKWAEGFFLTSENKQKLRDLCERTAAA